VGLVQGGPPLSTTLIICSAAARTCSTARCCSCPTDAASSKSSSSFRLHVPSAATTRSRTRSTVSNPSVVRRTGSWKLTYQRLVQDSPVWRVSNYRHRHGRHHRAMPEFPAQDWFAGTEHAASSQPFLAVRCFSDGRSEGTAASAVRARARSWLRAAVRGEFGSQLNAFPGFSARPIPAEGVWIHA
jgi:hypothetical protein